MTVQEQEKAKPKYTRLEPDMAEWVEEEALTNPEVRSQTHLIDKALRHYKAHLQNVKDGLKLKYL